MKLLSESQLKFKIRFLIILFITGLILSGITAFPIETQLSFLVKHNVFTPEFTREWIYKVYSAVKITNENYPFISYGTDWLAFAHIIIAVAFIGPYFNPVKNIWVIQFGMIACIMVLPLALIAGQIREIPFYWRIIDCSFGIFGFIPLYLCFNCIKKLEKLNTNIKL
jgi:hypothetical protein